MILSSMLVATKTIPFFVFVLIISDHRGCSFCIVVSVVSLLVSKEMSVNLSE